MSTKAKGRRFEYRVRDHFRERGYAVFRCAGSKPIDLIAIKKGEPVLLIECKSSSRGVGKVELEKLIELGERTGARVLLARPGKKRLIIDRVYN